MFPALVQHLMPHIGFAWAMRVAGFVALAFCACALALLRPRRHQRVVEQRRQQQEGSEPLIDVGALKEIPFVCFIVSSFLFFVALYFAFFYVSQKPFLSLSPSARWFPGLTRGHRHDRLT